MRAPSGAAGRRERSAQGPPLHCGLGTHRAAAAAAAGRQAGRRRCDERAAAAAHLRSARARSHAAPLCVRGAALSSAARHGAHSGAGRVHHAASACATLIRNAKGEDATNCYTCM